MAAVPHAVVERAPGRRLSLTVSGRPVTLAYRDHPARVNVPAKDAPPPLAIYTFRFAWRAVHADDTTWL